MLPKNVFYARMTMTLLIIIFSVLTVLNHKSALKIITELKEKAKTREKEERFRIFREVLRVQEQSKYSQ